MHTRQQDPPDPNFNYEVRDLPIHDVAKWIFWFYVLVVVAAPVAVLIMKKMGAPVGAQDAVHYELRRLPDANSPLLQDNATAHVDIANLRRTENAVLEGKKPNLDTNRTQLPIEKVIEQEAAKHDR